MLAGFSCLPSLAGLGFEDTVITPDFGQLNDEVCVRWITRFCVYFDCDYETT